MLARRMVTCRMLTPPAVRELCKSLNLAQLTTSQLLGSSFPSTVHMHSEIEHLLLGRHHLLGLDTDLIEMTDSKIMSTSLGIEADNA